MEPYRKRRWKKASSPERIAFYTCARPGRSLSKTDRVPDHIVHKWVKGLPGPNTTIISLLGQKPDGTSEFTFLHPPQPTRYARRNPAREIIPRMARPPPRRQGNQRRRTPHHRLPRSTPNHPHRDRRRRQPPPDRRPHRGARRLRRTATHGHSLQIPWPHRRHKKLRRMESSGVTADHA